MTSDGARPEVRGEVVCSACGAPIADESATCPSCGADLTAPNSAMYRPPIGPGTRVIAWTLLLFLVATFALAGYFAFRPAPFPQSEPPTHATSRSR